MMEITAQRSSIIYRPSGITLGILTTVLLWWLFSSNPATLALLAIAALFLFGLKRPVWAIAALIVSQLTTTSYMIETPFDFTISLRLLLMILTFIVVWFAYAQGHMDLGPKARSVIIPIVLLIVISAASNIVNTDLDYAFTEFRNMLVGLLFVILMPAVTQNSKDLKILCGVAFVVIAASAAIGIMQYYGVLGMEQATLIPNLLDVGQRRIPGMAERELELAYTLTTALLAILGILLFKGTSMGTRKVLLLSIVIIGVALYFTYTRSALLAVGFGLIALFMFLKTRIKGGMLLSIALVVLIIIGMTGLLGSQFLGGRSESAQEESSISRQVLWQAGIAIAIDNPVLGIGGNQYTSVSPEYAGNIDPSLLEWEEEQYWEYSTLGSEMIHNDFLHIWVSYGILALVIYLWLLICTLQNFLTAHKTSKTRFVKGLAIGLAVAVVAYCVNAFYHNTMATLPLLWILAGFSLATAKLAFREESHIQVSHERTGNQNV